MARQIMYSMVLAVVTITGIIVYAEETDLFRCDFEDGICGFEFEPSNPIDWTIHKGKTATVGTGPSVDHTLQTDQGYYFYIEATDLVARGTAKFYTEEFGATRDSCLEFFYYMYGKDCGFLTVYLDELDSGKTTALWKRWFDQGDEWKQAIVPLRTTERYKLTFEVYQGVSRNIDEGDIAVDDIVIRNSVCINNGACDFEIGTCEWQNDRTWNWITRKVRDIPNGPKVDRTLRTESGGILYIDYESNPVEGDSAQLVLTALPATDVNGKCLQFWYYTSGSYGTLNLYVDYSTTFPGKQLYFVLNADPTNEWTFATVPVVSTVIHTVIIEVVAGDGSSGFVAFDEITFRTGWCHVTPSTAEAPASPPIAPSTPAPIDPSPNDCDFETGLCLWTQSTGDDFDWIRKQASTGFGPNEDHTTGDGSGWYIYIETDYQSTDDMAWLESPTIPASATCLSFWYHMYGTRVNTLTVFIKTHDTKKNLWVHEGGEIDGWLYAYVPLDFTDSFQLVFEGRRGSTTHGDISIDDIRVYDTECRLAPYHSIVCDFEQEHWCDFIQDKNDDFDFKRTNGATASIGTGPSVDHTTNTEYGHYIYVDSSEQNAGDVARMWTPYITWDSASIRKCFHWYLHHQGITGSYTAYREFEYDGKPYTILCCFIVPENNLVFGDNWIRAGFDIYFYEHPNTRMRFQIVVTAADGDNGDMASDDYYVNDGKCPDRVNHDFDDGFGQWFNDRNGLRDEFDWVIGSGEHRYGMTGPDIDHTQRTTQGKYALCDVSGGSKGDRAVLESRTRFVQNKCITFWYHMYGEHVGELRLLLREGDDEILVWRLEGQQNKKDEWKKARVGWKNHISGGAAIAHLIEVIRGDGDYGDIAIDDVLSEGTYCDELLPPEANPNPVKSSNKIGMIVGIVLAALVFITLCAVICYRYRDSISTSTYKLFSRKEETDTTEIVDDQPRI